MSRRTIAWGCVALVAVAVVAFFGLKSSTGEAGRLAPALPAQRLSGPPTSLTSLESSAHGHRSAVVFWASWCGPCAKEAAAIESFATGAGRGRVVGVDWSDELAGARAFVRNHHWTFPNVRDGEGTVGNSYRMRGLPTTFVIGPHGHILAALDGPQTVATLTAALGSDG
jgi:thiol-disulfide isomerase/thioredoxin